MKFKFSFITLLCFLISLVTYAQDRPPTPVNSSVICANATLATTGTTGRLALTTGLPSCNTITVYNDGTVEAFVKAGDGTVVATTFDIPVPAGLGISFYATGTNVAAITASGTTTLRVFQGNGAVSFAGKRIPNSIALFDTLTPSSGIAFTQNVETQIPACSFTIPANQLLNAKDRIRWYASGTFISSTDTKTIAIRSGATLGTGSSGILLGAEAGTAVSLLNWTLQGWISKITTNSQRNSVSGTVQNSGLGTANSTTGNTVDANANLLIMTGKSNNASPPNDSVVCNEFHVWFEPSLS